MKGADDHEKEDPSKGGNMQVLPDGRGDDSDGLAIAENNAHRRWGDQEDDRIGS